MPTSVIIHETRCAICQTEGNATELYPANFSLEAFNAAIFSARRRPDRIHYRFVKCDHCGLVRADPVADAAALAQLYAESTFDYSDEVENIQRTYRRYLRKLGACGITGGRLLEIGCGNGFFLETARHEGFDVTGVEPSVQAAAVAPAAVRANIVTDIFRPSLFPPASMQVICLFQVIDHLPDPAGAVAECARLLAPGGAMLCLTHDVEAWSARLLKERSPIIDVEHTFLFSPSTIARLCEQAGLQTVQAGAAKNWYSLQYLLHLFPLPSAVKSATATLLRATGLGRLRLDVPLGNLYHIAQRP